MHAGIAVKGQSTPAVDWIELKIRHSRRDNSTDSRADMLGGIDTLISKEEIAPLKLTAFFCPK